MKFLKNLIIAAVMVVGVGVFLFPNEASAGCKKINVCHFEDGMSTTLLNVCKGDYFVKEGGVRVPRNGEDYKGICPEVCDYSDNDADEDVDEDFTDLGAICSVGIGECFAEGVQVCDESGDGTVCDAIPGSPTDEVCDGLDNDCDGIVDEDFDRDEDGYADCSDNCPDFPNDDQLDGDEDGFGDACDICEGYDDAIDTDLDGIPDGCDEYPNDFDNDGYDDDVDNCPEIYNAGQADADGDGIGNKCDDVDGRPKAKVIVHKIICDDEMFLPNWGAGGPDITKDTARSFIEENGEHCWFAKGWDFQWANSSAAWPAGDMIGEAPEYEGRYTFGSTNKNGRKAKDIVIPEDGKIKLREVLTDAYIPFSDGGDVSAEFYCHTDVKNYDNGDVIRNAVDGEKYYCVAFNVPKPGAIHITKWECPEWAPVSEWDLDPDGGLWDEGGLVNPEEYGCELAPGYDFTYDEDEEDIDLCTSDGNGECEVEMDMGEYMITEQGVDEMMDFYCSEGEPMIPMHVGVPPMRDVSTYAYVEPNETTHCVAFNYKPATITVNKYLCPERTEIGGPGWYPNMFGEIDEGLLAENNCVVGEGFDFGLVEMYRESREGRSFFMPEEEDSIDTFCTTESDGTCDGIVERGDYQLGELNNGQRSDSLMGLDCTSIIDIDDTVPVRVARDSFRFENPLSLYPSAGEKYVCVAYNPKPLEMCDGYIYATLAYGEEEVTFYLEDGYEDEWVGVYPNEDGTYTFEFHGSEEDRYAYANGTLTLFNGQVEGLDLSFEGGDKLEEHNEVYDTVEGDLGGNTITFALRIAGSGRYIDQFDFEVGMADECKASITGRKFYDVNMNGVFDREEKTEEGDPNRLNDWMISLYNTEWELLDSMQTGDDETPAGNVGNGQYRFVGLDAGTYYVCEEFVEGWVQTRPEVGIIDPETGLGCFEITLREGQRKTGVQFGNYLPEPYCGDGYVNGEEECDGTEDCDEECFYLTGGNSGRSSSVGGTPAPAALPSALLVTGPAEDEILDTIEEIDPATIPACNEDSYILERLAKLVLQDEALILEVPKDLEMLLGTKTLMKVRTLVNKVHAISDVSERNEIIRAIVCKIEIMKEKRHLRHAHIGRNSGGGIADYFLQYIQDLLILEFVVE